MSFFDPVAYLKGIDTLPHPPIYYSEDEASVTSSRRGALFLTWSMLLAALDGFVESGRILCPVRTHMGPVAKVVNFRDPDAEEKTTTCEQFVNDNAAALLTAHLRNDSHRRVRLPAWSECLLKVLS